VANAIWIDNSIRLNDEFSTANTLKLASLRFTDPGTMAQINEISRHAGKAA
jgi:hypothetical protein